MGNSDTYYDLLGVDRHASVHEIQKAYRRLAAQVHPDRPGGSPALFRLATGARDVLLDPSSRAAYDAEFLPVGSQGPEQQEAPIHEPPRAQNQTSQPSETRMEPNRTLLSGAERICRRRMAWSTAASLVMGAWSIYVHEMHGELLAGLPAFLLFCTYVWHWVVVRQSYSVMLSDWGLEWGRVPAIGPVIILVRLLGDSFGMFDRWE